MPTHPPARMRFEAVVSILKAAAETSRLRILVLLSHADLTVTDLTEILNQSQPRVSRHLKLLLDAELIARYQEGSWAFFRLAETEAIRELIDAVVARVDRGDPESARDLERLEAIKMRRQERAAEYFRENAASWDRIRSLHVPDAAVEGELTRLIGDDAFHSMVDLGTGTGRLLELLAPLYRRGTGVDRSREMLAVARANLERAGVTNAQVRLGDIYAPPVERGAHDLVTIHQVLHYLEEPAGAIREAARLLRPGGRLVIVDFATHGHEFLREEHAHLRLGFSDAQIADWLAEAGLDPGETRAFAPEDRESEGLTVKLWLARDCRQTAADGAAEIEEIA